MKKIIAPMIFALSAIILVSGCSSSDSTPPPTTLTGTAATGAPINGTVFVKDAKGVEKSIATAVNGSFTLDVPNMTPPYLLKIMPSSGPELYSYASKNGQTVNLTPTTNLAMFLAYGKNDLNTLYVGWDGTAVTASAVDAAEGTVRANLMTEMTAKGIDVASFDLFTTPFTADGTGIDGVMDGLNIVVNPGAGTFIFADNNSNDLGFDGTLTPPAPPAVVPAGAVSVKTYSGATVALNGVYKTACYQTSGGVASRIDLLTVNGSEWVNGAEEYASLDCTGSPTVSAITATLTTLGTFVVPATTGWIDGMGAPTAVLGADGTTTLSAADTTVTTLNVKITAVTGTAFSIPVGFTATVFYMVDDTGSGQVLYRDQGGLFVSAADPYIQ